MSQDEINKDLGSYLHERKDKPFWKKYNAINIKPRSDEDIDVAIKHDIEQVAEKEEAKIAPEDKQELESMEGQIAEVDKIEKTVEKDIEQEHENVLQKFFKKLNRPEQPEKPYEDAVMSDNPDITMDDEEMRQLLHGLHNWIIQLPADKLERFKNSKEFELYTKYLRKHNLIK